MKTTQRAIQLLACGFCALAVAPSASAEAQAGFYIGLSAGESSYDIEQAELDDVVLDAFFSQGAPVLSGSSTLEDSDTSVALVAGYRFLPYVAVEASYLNLGTAEYRSVGAVNPPGPVTSAPASLDFDVESKGVTVSGIGSLPLGNVVDLHGRLGLFFAQTDISVVARISTSVAEESDSLESVGAFYGVGAGFHLGEHWSLSLDWTRYDNVGDEDEDDDIETEAGFDIDALSLSAAFRF